MATLPAKPKEYLFFHCKPKTNNLKFLSEGLSTACRLCSTCGIYLVLPANLSFLWFPPYSGCKSCSTCGTSGFHADYLVTKCGVLMMSLFVFFTTTMSVSFTLRETQTRMLKFTGLFTPPFFFPLVYTNSVIHLMCCKRVLKVSSCCWISWWVNPMDTRIYMATLLGCHNTSSFLVPFLKIPSCQFIAVQLQHHARHRLPTFQLIFVHVIESLVFVPVSIHFYPICMRTLRTCKKLSYSQGLGEVITYFYCLLLHDEFDL